jgi:uncharacterized peroxidase-related enzyme
MTWIKTIKPENADGDLGEVYRLIASARKGIADIHRAQSLNPRALVAHLELYKAIVFARSPLSRIMRERIGVVVSAVNKCVYCVSHHAEALRILKDDEAVIQEIRRGLIPDQLPDHERLLLHWASETAAMPSSASREQIEQFKQSGLDDRSILDAALTVAYFSFVNRLVLLLGIELEDGFEKTCGDADSHSKTLSPDKRKHSSGKFAKEPS